MEVVAVFIPIIFILTTGLSIVAIYFFRSRERQMLIEKGLTTEEIKEFYTNKKKANNYWLLKVGIICFFFGLGLGFGIMLNENTYQDHWVPLLLFTMTGLGFIVANLTSRKLEKSDQ